VVLNSCQSGATGTSDLFAGTAATLVRSGINAVVAMQFAVSDYAALAFAKSFYLALASGRRIDEAVRSGRIGILGITRDTLEWITPVLYLGSSDTRLFDAAAPPVAAAAAPHVAATAAPPDPAPAAVATPEPAVDPSLEEPTAVAASAAPLSRSIDDTAGSPTPPATPPPGAPPDERPPRRRGLLIGGAIVAAAVIAGGLAWGATVLLPKEQTGSSTPPVQTSAETPPPPTPTTVTVQVPATVAWNATGVSCVPGDVLEISATGIVNLGPAAEATAPPDGAPDPALHQFNLPELPDSPHAGLAGRIDQSPAFFVGSSVEHVCDEAGQLFLGVNDEGVDNNAGAFEATITKTEAGE
jgi:hypothetical protein